MSRHLYQKFSKISKTWCPWCLIHCVHRSFFFSSKQLFRVHRRLANVSFLFALPITSEFVFLPSIIYRIFFFSSLLCSFCSLRALFKTQEIFPFESKIVESREAKHLTKWSMSNISHISLSAFLFSCQSWLLPYCIIISTTQLDQSVTAIALHPENIPDHLLHSFSHFPDYDKYWSICFDHSIWIPSSSSHRRFYD